jgi:hypothetical protein
MAYYPINCGNNCGLQYMVDDIRVGNVLCTKCGTIILDRAIDVNVEWQPYKGLPCKFISDPAVGKSFDTLTEMASKLEVSDRVLSIAKEILVKIRGYGKRNMNKSMMPPTSLYMAMDIAGERDMHMFLKRVSYISVKKVRNILRCYSRIKQSGLVEYHQYGLSTKSNVEKTVETSELETPCVVSEATSETTSPETEKQLLKKCGSDLEFDEEEISIAEFLSDRLRVLRVLQDVKENIRVSAILYETSKFIDKPLEPWKISKATQLVKTTQLIRAHQSLHNAEISIWGN